MQNYRLTCEMLTRLPLRDTFAVFEDPYNLAKITPPWLNFVVTTPGCVRMQTGAEIEYRIRWLGLPLHWKTVIEDYRPPHVFVDRQARGPYRLWRHRHTFFETADGTLVRDQVDYLLPFGILGRLAHKLVVARQLKGIFEYRQQALTGLFGGRAIQTQAPRIERVDLNRTIRQEPSSIHVP